MVRGVSKSYLMIASLNIMQSGAYKKKRGVELEMTKEKTTNTFIFSQITQDNFIVALQNDLFGQVFGKGIISDIAIDWEFHGQDLTIEGFEIYQHLFSDEYATRA